jgi:hypothetical protein
MISPGGLTDSLKTPSRAPELSPLMKGLVEEGIRHLSALGADQVREHSLGVFRAACEGRIVDPQADENDRLSLAVTKQIFIHSLTSESHLPTNLGLTPQDLETFNVQRRFSHLDSRGGDRSAAYVDLINDQSIDLTSLLVAAYTRIADMTTVHDPATLAASDTNMPGVFPVHSDWKTVTRSYADPMLRIYCPIADWGGQTGAYRQMRDNAMLYLHPEYFQEVAVEVMRRTAALRKTNSFMLQALQTMSTRLGLKLIVGPDYREISKAFPSLGPDTAVVALKPFKGVGGLLNKSLKRGIAVPDIHDWAGLTVITDSIAQMYQVASYLVDEGVMAAARSLGLRTPEIAGPVDYAAQPKPITNYQSIHVDSLTRDPEMVNTEFIVRTLQMHMKADEGEANHDSYKHCPLQNGERKRFMERKQEITESNLVKAA